MTFEKIGPFGLTWRDKLTASLIISFLMGSIATRIACWLALLSGLVMLVLGPFLDDPFFPLLGALMILAMFGAPVLRARNNFREIYVQQDPDGLTVDTRIARVTYKWSTIRKVRKVGPRLFVLVTAKGAVLIPDRATSAANIEKLQAVIAEKRTASAG